jgi:hypothetical protein
MKTTVWKRGTVTIYVGGDPEKGDTPEITIDIKDPQILFDSGSNKMIIVETK